MHIIAKLRWFKLWLGRPSLCFVRSVISFLDRSSVVLEIQFELEWLAMVTLVVIDQLNSNSKVFAISLGF